MEKCLKKNCGKYNLNKIKKNNTFKAQINAKNTRNCKEQRVEHRIDVQRNVKQ